MSSEENTTTHPHTDVRELHTRQHRTPKHLEEYILAYNPPRPALSSHLDHKEHKEQIRAAATAGSGQADGTFHLGPSRASRSSTPGDLLSTTSLRQLVESISRTEEEEKVEMAEITQKLCQYEHRQRRRQDLLEHITSFLQEEEENEETHKTEGATPTQVRAQSSLNTLTCVHSPWPSTPAERQVHHMEAYTERDITTNMNFTPEGKAEPRNYNPGVVREGANSAFIPIRSTSPKHTSSSHPSISTGQLTPISNLQQPIRPTPLQTHVTRLYCSKDETSSRHQQQLLTTTALHYLPTAPYPRPQAMMNYPPPQSPAIHGQPQYTPMPSSAMPPQVLPFAPMLTEISPTFQAQFPANQSTAPHNFSLQPRPIYGVPTPKIPDFITDNEREFANLKLALDNLLEPYPDLSEKYKYHVLLEHLKLPEAQMIGQSCRHDPFPYSATMHALQLQYGQPHQLAQAEIAAIVTAPAVKSGDAQAFQSFALRVHLLVSMLLSLEGPQGMELNCCSHVDHLLSKLPRYYRDGFIEYLQLHGKLNTKSLNPYNLQDLNGWLQGKAQQQRLSNRLVQRYQLEKPANNGKEKIPYKGKGQSVAVYHGADPIQPNSCNKPASSSVKKPYKVHCLFCDSTEHYISRCPTIKVQSTAELDKWITEGKRCWKCARAHTPESCNLKKPCSDCGDIHLQVLHGIAQHSSSHRQPKPSESRVYLTPSTNSSKVLLKVVPVLLHNKSNSVETFAVLDDGAQRTMILPTAVQQLRLNGALETLALRTVRTDVTHLQGSKVSFEISSKDNPQKRFKVQGAFTAAGLDLVEQTYPIQTLQKRYSHLRGIPLKSFNNVQPLVLLGSDHVHLITPIEPIRKGSKGGPIAIHTTLGWALQGAEKGVSDQALVQQCLFTSFVSPEDLLYRNVERLWQLDVLPFRNEKIVVRSREDQEAMNLLETKTQRLKIEGICRYATPLLRKPGAPTLSSSIHSVIAHLRATEKRLKKEPERATIYLTEINKLINAGYVKRLQPMEVEQSAEAWYLPHHLVLHNNKPRLVFNCSFRHQNISLNDQLLPGPKLGPSLVGVLIRFRQHQIAVSGDIRAMFHQIHLLPEDRSLLRFIWRDLHCEDPPEVYEWQVLPFGTTSSPCCAIFALQQHARNHQDNQPEVLQSVQQSFYVDNCLESFPTISTARERVDQLRTVLAEGGFDLRQWASNQPAVVAHLPADARSSATEQWLSQNRTDPLEPTLGLRWNCAADTLGYQYRIIEHSTLTMRKAYQVLASQYDPLGFMVPFTTRAKVIIQQLWSKQRGWDDPDLPPTLREEWETWESELKHLNSVSIPRCYLPLSDKGTDAKCDLHIFCDASERAYGAVAYLTFDAGDTIHTSFVMARSRVSPKRQQSIPRLELCAALAGAQLSKLLQTEMTLPIRQTVLWSDSTTVLEWIQSESCRYKVFVGTRVSEIQELTERQAWRYVDSPNNPADDITRAVEPNNIIPDATQYNSWKELVGAIQQDHGAATEPVDKHIISPRDAEVLLLRGCQAHSFPREVTALKAQKPLPSNSNLLSLAPEWDAAIGLIRVGGRLRRLENPNIIEIHPIVLDPRHPAVKLLIKDMDEHLKHPGTERVYAELRRHYWILRGRQAIRHHQLNCPTCQRWRAQPKVPQMADLPPQRLRLLCPPFYSTGVDCFGPFLVKIDEVDQRRCHQTVALTSEVPKEN
ncbi:uncharacterized protein LOC106939156 [Poecilia latipinna]|uniref:uncharacterized protein LOC106939156 n=1 Tax=Poecilia latipinna TaxID=48699 RepID=UPI00072E3886|nr:PREDICTED: uncharacterized protein LOC106939156 [Poecilia latipinna]